MIALILNNALITPKVGLVFWTLLTFITLLIVLRKVAWGPILNGLKERENFIKDSLNEADKARKEMQNLNQENEKLWMEARSQRDALLKEAKITKDEIIEKAKTEAEEERKRILAQTREMVEKEKEAAKRELKEFVINLSMDAATKILKRELANAPQQEELVEAYITSNVIN
jgi:F-type H+-transporting ATPase subunit b